MYVRIMAFGWRSTLLKQPNNAIGGGEPNYQRYTTEKIAEMYARIILLAGGVPGMNDFCDIE
jgi:hypothetical protein